MATPPALSSTKSPVPSHWVRPLLLTSPCIQKSTTNTWKYSSPTVSRRAEIFFAPSNLLYLFQTASSTWSRIDLPATSPRKAAWHSWPTTIHAGALTASSTWLSICLMIGESTLLPPPGLAAWACRRILKASYWQTTVRCSAPSTQLEWTSSTSYFTIQASRAQPMSSLPRKLYLQHPQAKMSFYCRSKDHRGKCWS